MIFHDDKLLFFHPGKTAGTSVEQMLAPGHKLDPYKANRERMYGWDDELGIFLQHANCATTRQIVEPRIFSEYFKFCVVRNPFTRLVSAYYYLYDLHEKKYGSFRNYILSLPREIETVAARRGIHESRQYDYTHIDGVQCVDAIIKFETLSELEQLLSEKLGRELKLPQKNIVKNSTRSQTDDLELYDKEMINIVTRLYQTDFDTFSYDKEIPAPTKQKKPKMQTSDLPRIFVQIPTYRDEQTQWTVKDLFEKAKHPERVFVGLCWQYDKENDSHCFEIPYPRPENVRMIEFSHLESQGLGWARQQAQTLAADEEYTLQIDAHMRFEQDWDQLLIDMHNQCPGEKVILSHYPPSFILPDKYVSDSVPYMYPAQINNAGISIEKSFAFSTTSAPPKPILNYFVAGGMIFAPSSLFREVPPDPHIYFWGEQVGTAVRAWTRGWNIYSPHRNTVYHIYHPSEGRPLNWDDNPDWVAKTNKTAARMQYLLGIKETVPEEYAEDSQLLELGEDRALVEYEQLAGLCFRQKKILPHTIDYCIERLRQAGSEINEHSEEWYRSLFVIDLILYEEDEDTVLSKLNDFVNVAKVARHKFATLLQYSKRCLDKRKLEEAEEFAFRAMRTDSSKPNGYAMIGRILMRQGKYNEALPFLTTANHLCQSENFAPILVREPHPLTLLALTYCKKLMPTEAAEYASKALNVDANSKAGLQAILDEPNNPVKKEFWLFPDKKAIFDQLQLKDEISKDWQEWAKHNISNGADRDIIRLKIEDVGFKATLVKELLDNLENNPLRA